MKLFINDVLVHIVGYDKVLKDKKFHFVIENSKDWRDSVFVGEVLVKSADKQQVVDMVTALENQKYPHLDGVTLRVENKVEMEKIVKRMYRIVPAAGGLVCKDQRFLMIYRLKKWDLPKGKLEKGETIDMGALREVEEECCVKVKNKLKLGNTWHTYSRSGKRLLKKTTWYLMDCLDDSKMKPQTEEDIEDIQWCTWEQVQQNLEKSYGSIAEVFKKYKKKSKSALPQS